MLLETRAAPPFYKNGFVLACERTREGVIIDPGDEVEDLLAIVQEHQVDVKYILLTHAHMDHITGVRRARQVTCAPVYLHRDDNFLYEAAGQQGRAFGFQVEQPPPVDHFYVARLKSGTTSQGAAMGVPGRASEYEPLYFGDYEVRVHHTPGHCPGGVCLQVGRKETMGKQLFVGDTLFAGSIGRTDLPGGDYDTLMASIRNVLFSFGDDAEVFPGHGPKTTIGQERATNPFLR
ncbi:MAG: MBL fold metallo-hydrolase [Acidobacteria bacterium]|nr:MBL fold metallo-hydrolase [Acidobacteriota bacterium]